MQSRSPSPPQLEQERSTWPSPPQVVQRLVVLGRLVGAAVVFLPGLGVAVALALELLLPP